MLTRDTMLSSRPTVQKRRTIVMLTSSNQTIVLHFAETRPKIRPFFPFFPVFFRVSYALAPRFSPGRQTMRGKGFVKI